MKHFVGVGACYLDTILSIPHFVVEDEKLRASSIARRRGGNCPNTIEVLQQLIEQRAGAAELQANLVAVLPNRDAAAVNDIEASLGGQSVLRHCIYREDQVEPASSYIIRNTATSSRTIINYNALQEMTSAEFKDIADTLGNEAGRIPDVSLECMLYLRQQYPGVKISVELENPAREGLQELALHADVVFFSKSWALVSAESDYSAAASLLCCTWGEDGAWAYEPVSGMTHHAAAHHFGDDAVVDTIGAGDTFIAGILYGMLFHSQDWRCAERLRFANEIAGQKVLQEGFAGLGALMAEV
ncbi:pfkB family kinase [Apiospora hydei]|uniref:PfkB family kinase n=1 Tax=Apiospora hydei TaxID=1337664 RepID=A0ABR1VVN6_9PEZI